MRRLARQCQQAPLQSQKEPGALTHFAGHFARHDVGLVAERRAALLFFCFPHHILDIVLQCNAMRLV